MCTEDNQLLICFICSLGFILKCQLKTNYPFCVCFLKGDAVDYQKQLKQMLKDLAKEKDTRTEKELPKMSQVCTSEAVDCFKRGGECLK